MTTVQERTNNKNVQEQNVIQNVLYDIPKLGYLIKAI